MGKVRRNLQMEICIKGSIKEVNQMVMVSIIGKMAVTLRAISKMVWDKVMVCGKKDPVLATNTKESTWQIRKMVMVSLLGQLAIFIRAIINRIWGQDMEKCIGMMVVTIKDSGKKECKMEKDSSLHPNKASKKGSLKIMCWFRSKRSSLLLSIKGWIIT